MRDVDPHRPAIDEVEFACPECAGVAGGLAAGAALGDLEPELAVLARRVEPVIDAWFDSGSMPAAQVGYPCAAGSEAAFSFPADFITEAIDQTRGWFYSLLAVNTLVFDRAPYRHVMCLGHIVDADGRKMSKSVGNVIDPWEILGTRGADPLRWWMFSQGSPWTPTRVSLAAIDTSLRETLLTLWNTFSFFTTYASLNGFDPADPAMPGTGRPPGARPVGPVPAGLHGGRGDPRPRRLRAAGGGHGSGPAGRRPLQLVRAAQPAPVLADRPRRAGRRLPGRPGHPARGADHAVAAAGPVLPVPVRPRVAGADRRRRRGFRAPGRLAGGRRWPDAAVDPALEAQMALARRLASLGRAARSEAGVKVRQPLARALVFLPPGAPPLLEGVVADELNVDEVVVAEELGEVLQFELVPNFKELGPRLGPAVKELKPALASLDAAAAAEALEAGGTVTVALPAGPVELGPGEVDLRVRGQAGFAVSREGGEVVALDLALDDDLRRRGAAREVVRQVQDLRKTSGLDVSDRIRLYLVGLDELSTQFDTVAREVLATEIAAGPGPGEGTPLDLDGIAGAVVWLERA